MKASQPFLNFLISAVFGVHIRDFVANTPCHIFLQNHYLHATLIHNCPS